MFAGAYAPNAGGVQQHTGGGYYGNGAAAGAGGSGNGAPRHERQYYPRGNFGGAAGELASMEQPLRLEACTLVSPMA